MRYATMLQEKKMTFFLQYMPFEIFYIHIHQALSQ